MISPLQAAILGIVEGLTEFLPISSTGHLILTGKLLGIGGNSAKAFEVIIQGGALVAVAGLYRERLKEMGEGILGRNAKGLRIFLNILISFLPAAIIGLLFHHRIKDYLFNTSSVTAALILGGILMIGTDGFTRDRRNESRRHCLSCMSFLQAFLIGLAQVLALWPGVSRSMVTIVAALLLGYTAVAAAEYSFLLALPTLTAAVLFDLGNSFTFLFHDVTLGSVLIGFFTAAAVASLAIRSFLNYLNRRGLAPFGWYRIALALLVWRFVR